MIPLYWHFSRFLNLLKVSLHYSITNIKQVIGRWLHPISTYSGKVWLQKIAEFFNELII